MSSEINIDFYKRLAAAIITTTCTDYIAALSSGDERMKFDYERFFASEWCDFLAEDVDGLVLQWRIKDCMRKFEELAQPYFTQGEANKISYEKSITASFRCPLCGCAVYVSKRPIPGFNLDNIETRCGSCDAFQRKQVKSNVPQRIEYEAKRRANKLLPNYSIGMEE